MENMNTYEINKRNDKQEIIELAEELGIETSEIWNRLNEECNPLDEDNEHDEIQRVLSDIRKEHLNGNELPRSEQLAQIIQGADSWEDVQAELEELCELAGLGDTWQLADGETFVTAISEAARILEVEIY